MRRVTNGDYRVIVQRIAIAGGIGAGKTMVTDRLADFGWPVIDADLIAHRVTAAGRPAWEALRDAFGDAILEADGELDRPFLAQIVFNDASSLRRLNLITHRFIGEEMARQLGEASGDAAFVAIPLYRPEHRKLFDLGEVWAVQTSPETAIARLCASRGFIVDDANARVASQMTNEERLAIVDRVIWNEGTVAELYAQVDDLLRLVGLERG